MCRNENSIINNQARYSDIYYRTYIAAHYPFWIHPHIHQICIRGCTYYPQLSTFIYTCVKYVNIPLTTANTPLDRRLDDHALIAHTYRSVEAYRSIHYHSCKWHPYNFTPYGRRKKTNNAYHGVEVCDPSIQLHAIWTMKGKTLRLVLLSHLEVLIWA